MAVDRWQLHRLAPVARYDPGTGVFAMRVAVIVLASSLALALGAVEPDWRDGIQVIANGRVRVGADARHGGRLVEYALDGRNALYADPAHPGWVYPDDHDYIGPAGGRVDIGPEETLPAHPGLWLGPWAIERVDALHLRMTSPEDAATGVRLVRDVVLEAGSTRLRCTQTIRNTSDRPLRRAFWSRTLAPGGGIFVTALTPDSRFPKGYIQYSNWPDYDILMRPADPAITISGDLLVLRGTPLRCKTGLDTRSGWLAYAMRGGLLFVKRFPVHPERRYADIAGLTIAVWSLEDRMVELEALGPEELLAPGQEASFAEDWWLFDYRLPAAGEDPAPQRIREFAERNATPAP